MAYITWNTLDGENRYFENFAGEFYGTNGTVVAGTGTITITSDVAWAGSRIDEDLRSTGRFHVLPVQQNNDGTYPQFLQDWSANLVIFTKMMSRLQGEYQDIPDSILFFGSNVARIKQSVESGDAIFDSETDVGEKGIGAPSALSVGTDTRGTFFNNYQGYPFDGRYKFNDDTYPRTWVCNIVTSGGLGTAKFTWSKNSNATVAGTETVDMDWLLLDNYVYVRFEPDNSGNGTFSSGDSWSFRTVPLQQRAITGSTFATIIRAKRG
jgi:hypothetical protein